MKVYLLAVAYLILHLLMYLAVTRLRMRAPTEQQVFAYHVYSFLGLGLVLSLAWLAGSADGPAWAAGLASHAVYSVFFLNIWSLSEGSYFMEVLRQIERTGGLPEPRHFVDLERIGDQKRVTRMAALQRLNLIRCTDGIFSLTGSGSLVAGIFVTVRWMANHKTAG